MKPSPSLPSMIGAYGPWAAGLLPATPGPLSLQACPPAEFAARRAAARARVEACMAPPPRPGAAKPEVRRRLVHDGLAIEELAWQLPYGQANKCYIFLWFNWL